MYATTRPALSHLFAVAFASVNISHPSNTMAILCSHGLEEWAHIPINKADSGYLLKPTPKAHAHTQSKATDACL